MSSKVMTGFGGMGISRRAFLASSAALAAWPRIELASGAEGGAAPRFQKNPFQLGVASGDPLPDGIVLWTRLATEPLEGGGLPPEDIKVRWELARDEGFREIVQSGVANAPAKLAHSVHVEVEGLKPDYVYWYRFRVGDAVSPVGRTRTAPAPDAMLDRFRFAFASCQHFESGYYTAYEHMLKDDLSLVIHLGDYIYEGAGTSKTSPRKHLGKATESLDEYRNRYALYKTDLHLQAVHAAFPWVVTWDDHEVANNYAGGRPEKETTDPVAFLARRANAYQAYYEHMPLRRAQFPSGPDLQLYRRLKFGQLLQFDVLDTRQYRTDQPCGDGNRPPCEEVFSPEATMLGAQQESWLLDGLKTTSARWNVLAQQVMMGRVDRDPDEGKVAWSMDKWSGYDVARRRLMQSLAEMQVPNPVVLTGDIHSSWVNELKVDFDDMSSPNVATEFVGTSISSGGDGVDHAKSTDQVLAQNPFVKFFNAQRGYVRCDVKEDRWQTDYQVVDYISRPGASVQTKASFMVENGRVQVERA